jgi:hypothetical protein
MRQGELWARLLDLLGAGYVGTWSESVVHADLDGRTVRQAVDDGLDVRRIWLAAAENLEVPHHAR